jgi:hypothetical protein
MQSQNANKVILVLLNSDCGLMMDCCALYCELFMVPHLILRTVAIKINIIFKFFMSFHCYFPDTAY